MKKLLVFADHWMNYSPGQRYLIEAFWNSLKKANINPVLIPLRTPDDEHIIRSKGNLLKKSLLIFKWMNARRLHLNLITRNDVVMVYRYVYPFITNWFERAVKKRAKATILVIDEAYWMQEPLEYHSFIKYIESIFCKFPSILRYFDGVIVTNPYCASLIAPHSSSYIIIPDVYDTDRFSPSPHRNTDEKVRIGWSGSHSTFKYIKPYIPLLKKIKEQTNTEIIIMGAINSPETSDSILYLPWNEENELNVFRKVDIGLAPYPDYPLSHTKCPGKIIMYLSLGIPVIASPRGMIPEMVIHEYNGFLAETTEEWEKYIITLINNPELRRQMGENARKHAIEKFSVHAHEKKFVNYINSFFTVS